VKIAVLLSHLLAVGNFDFARPERSDFSAQIPHKSLTRETLAHLQFSLLKIVGH
jgi:hypothetical protein